MKPTQYFPAMLIGALISSLALTACGGGASTSASASPVADTASATPNVYETSLLGAFSPVVKSPTSPTTPPTTTVTPPSLQPTTPALPTPPINVVASDVITDVTLQSTISAGATQTNVPVTFGQVFAPGNLLATKTVVGRLADGSTMPLQVDVKASHPDGSVRHAVISGIVPSLAPNESRLIGLAQTPLVAQAGATPAAMLAAGFTSKIVLTMGGQTYSVAAEDLLKSNYTTWLAGPIANEWLASAPLKNAAGVSTPHLMARFAVRWYANAKKARVDVTIENGWAFEPNPQNYVYDANILVGGASVYKKSALKHFHHARWRKIFWWGGAPEVHVRHNTKYLISSRAVPNYDQSLVMPEADLAGLKTEFTGALAEPMGPGLILPGFGTTGGRRDIGLLPAWQVQYLLSMDKRAKDVMLGTADLAGSFSTHYRDKNTDRAVSVIDFPYMTLLGRHGDTLNPATGKFESFPDCAAGADCTSTLDPETSHQPNMAYLPYLVTGDYYYLEEMQLWCMWNVLSSNPGYRENIKGLIFPDQVRGQAWTLRTLAESAYATPDKDVLKSHFAAFLSNNLDWYNANYSNNASANLLGILVGETALAYNNATGIAPWQDDFFTSAVGHTAELGFTKATSLLAYKIKFPIMRMTSSDACWLDGAIYAMTVRNSATSPFFSTMGEAYRASHTSVVNALACNSAPLLTLLGVTANEMTGYSSSPIGYPSNMQPALAYSADAGGTGGSNAWKQFMARSVKPDYNTQPQFAIIPR